MWKFIMMLSCITTARSYPTEDTAKTLQSVVEENQEIAQFEKNLGTVSYIQNFKNMMADYVKQQYKNLTIDDMEQVKASLEEFLKNFAMDLHDAIMKRKMDPIEEVNDGIPDSTFEDVKKSIKSELSDINDEMIEQIVYKLRKNLFKTRQKLDEVIRSSENAKIVNS